MVKAMSHDRQLPNRIIRDYLDDLAVFKKRFTHEDFVNRFVEIYRRDVPPSDDVPEFKEVHRRDELKVAKAKIDANYKKFWRAIDGTTYLPLVFVEPIVETLRTYGDLYALELDRLLLRNRGWLAIPIPTGKNDHAEIYSRMLMEFSQAHSEVASDLADDGVLNNPKTGKEALDAVEAMMAVYLAAQPDTSKVVTDLQDRIKKVK
jgi:hypothetical protein